MLYPFKKGGELTEEEYKKQIYMMDDFNGAITRRASKLSEKDFQTIDIDFYQLERLGAGEFGSVYKYASEIGEEFVLKKINIPEILKKEINQKAFENGIYTEIIVNRIMKDDNIIYAKNAFKTKKGEYCILFERMERTLQ